MRMSPCSGMLKALRHNFYQLAHFPLSHIQGIPYLTRLCSVWLPPPSHSPSSGTYKSSAPLNPSHCPCTILGEVQHILTPPWSENIILKGCNIAAILPLCAFVWFFDQNSMPCPPQTVDAEARIINPVFSKGLQQTQSLVLCSMRSTSLCHLVICCVLPY